MHYPGTTPASVILLLRMDFFSDHIWAFSAWVSQSFPSIFVTFPHVLNEQCSASISVGDPDPGHVFKAFRIRIHLSEVRVRLRILPFSHKDVERTEIVLCLQNKNFNTKFVQKIKFFRLKIKVPAGKLNKKIKNNKICFLEATEERSRIRIRIHLSEVRIRGSGSTSKCHGAPTLVSMMLIYSLWAAMPQLSLWPEAVEAALD